jgi:SAM-dependent methyltransferase
MASLIAEASGVEVAEAERRLEVELRHPGRSVAEDFAARGGPRYTPGPQMDAFYASTDAFLYELAVWNNNRLKIRMRRWIGRHMGGAGRPLDVLSIGDGLGFDCLHLARQGHRVTYFELPGQSERFARRLFEQSDVAIPMLSDPAAIPAGAFDAITCLDVLEHVPDPPAMVRTLATYLRPGGLLYVSAPFQLVLRWYPTHLRESRRYAGDLRLYEQAGFTLVGGRAGWDPIVVQKADAAGQKPNPMSARVSVLLAKPLWTLGRYVAWPYVPLHFFRRLMSKEFR